MVGCLVAHLFSTKSLLFQLVSLDLSSRQREREKGRKRTNKCFLKALLALSLLLSHELKKVIWLSPDLVWEGTSKVCKSTGMWEN